MAEQQEKLNFKDYIRFRIGQNLFPEKDYKKRADDLEKRIIEELKKLPNADRELTESILAIYNPHAYEEYKKLMVQHEAFPQQGFDKIAYDMLQNHTLLALNRIL